MKFLSVSALVLTFFTFSAFSEDDLISMGVLSNCPLDKSDPFVQNILSETRLLLESDYQVILEASNIRHSDCTSDRIAADLDLLLKDDEVDIILALDPISSHYAAKNGPYDKPVISAVVLSASAQGLPITERGTSGVKNLTYVQMPFSPVRDLEVFHEMIDFERLALVIDERIFKNIPEIKAFFDSGFDALGFGHEFIFTDQLASEALEQLEGHDAVYLFPSSNLSDEQSALLIEGINKKKMPSFSLFGRPDVNRGVLGGLAPASNIQQISRRIALDIQRLVNKDGAEDFPVGLLQKEELVINMATARQIDYSPTWEIMARAVIINETPENQGPTWNLFSAIARGIEENLNLQIAERSVEIAREDVNIATSNLRPSLTAAASHTIVNEQLAAASNGQNPQSRGVANLQLSQVIYSESATANKKIRQYLYEAERQALQVQTLDVILDVSTAYLGLMQAKTAERIQKQNLEVTRKNLEIAEISTSLGQSGPSDLYRWQGELATAKANLLNATAQRRQAEFNLNQILNEPIGTIFQTEELTLLDTRFLVNDPEVSQYVGSPREFYQYVDFMVTEAKTNIPDLKQLDLNVRAQERTLVLNQRNRYMPVFSLGGSYNYEMYRNGAGTEFPQGFGVPNDWNWNLQVGASLPIFQGGSRVAQVQQSKAQLSQLNTQRLNTERLFEQQVRSELENIRASYTNIGLTQEAEEAVVKNFRLIQESYTTGIVTITQLLDAQNAAVSAQLNSANALYVFLIDLLNLERATGSYYMLKDEQERTDYRERLRSHFNE